MENQNIIVGLDIGTTKICVLVGRMNEYGKLDIIGMGKSRSDGVVRGAVTNVDKTVFNVTAAIKEAENQSNFAINEVNVGIAGVQVRCITVNDSIMRGPSEGEISVGDVYRLVDEQNKQIIPNDSRIVHILPQEFTVDGTSKVQDPVGMPGKKLECEFQIITAPKQSVINIENSLRRAGVRNVDTLLEPLASSLSVLTKEEMEMGVALVDIGGGTTDISIFCGGIVRRTTVIPLGGNLITADIRDLKLLDAQAEDIKLNHTTLFVEDVEPDEVVVVPGVNKRPASHISARALTEIIHWRVRDILVHVHQEIINSQYEHKLGAGIVLTGGGAKLPKIDQLCSYITGLETRIGYPNEHLGQVLTEISEEIKSPAYATAVGLLLAGFRSYDERVNDYEKTANIPWPGNAIKGTRTIVATQPGTAAAGSQKPGLFGKVLEKARNLLINTDDSGKSGY
jgi:cell division protein FtsA